MGYDFTLYEITNYDHDKTQKEFNVKEVLYLSNSTAMLISNWLYRNNIHGHVNDEDKCYHYVNVYGWQLKHCLENLNTVLNEPDENKKDLLALFYFPCKYTVSDYASSTGMFSDSYYGDLDYIRTRLIKILDEDNDEQVFLYNLAV